MTAPALRTDELGKRYGANWALRNCTFEIAVGSVAALVGPNGAGKTTLLQLVVGLIRPSTGNAHALGHSVRRELRELLPKVGFVAQEHPLHRGFTISEMLEYGRKLNPTWDATAAAARIERLDLPLNAKVGKLSGGSRRRSR